LRIQIDGLQRYVPFLRELSKESIKGRLWGEVMKIGNKLFDIYVNPDLKDGRIPCWIITGNEWRLASRFALSLQNLGAPVVNAK